MIIIKDLRKVYRVGEVDVEALRGVSLDVERGEFVSIVGPSGSGKSTLFHVLGGLASATTGKVIIDGEDVSAMKDAERTRLRRTKVGFVFQRYNLLPTLTAMGNIMVARYFGGHDGELESSFVEMLKLMGIDQRLHHKPRALSGGEQQRVAIARALVNRPAILLADEPTGNLDTENSNKVLGVLHDLNRSIGQTILMITHNPEAAAYGHRTVHMRDGRIVKEV
jgi:putative ABC transport system ATP-binding protein